VGNDGLSVNQITEKLLWTNTLSPLLKRMENGILQRTRSIEDERSIVQLTEKEVNWKASQTHSLKTN
jgi:DNA-binding MarR family transcriptional regulator